LINIDTGSLDEAIHWLEYCNSTGNTHHAKLRGENGHPEPYRVKYWVPYILKMLEGWIRRRLRMCLLKQWKKVRTKYRNLIKLGLPD